MPAPQAEAGLGGARVLVTRPAHQARQLAELIAAAGGEPVCFPVIEIAEPHDPHVLEQLIDRLPEYQLAIFVSTNAVEHALPRVRSRLGGWPAQLQAAAVGAATAQALARHGVPALAPAGGFDSEALLALPTLHAVRGKHIVIFRGQGGRELLADTLAARGARVHYAECYRRRLPVADFTPLLQHWVDVVTLTSVEALHNLFTLAGAHGQARLRATPMIVASARIAEASRAFELAQAPRVAPQPSDAGIVQALKAWRASQNPV